MIHSSQIYTFLLSMPVFQYVCNIWVTLLWLQRGKISVKQKQEVWLQKTV